MNKSHFKPESIESYLIGFALSIFCTILAYIFVVNHVYTGWVLTGSIVVLAIVQLLVQVIFFLHLGSKSKPKINTIFFATTCLVVIILVFGSIWIMNNLNYNMMSPNDTNNYIINDELLSK